MWRSEPSISHRAKVVNTEPVPPFPMKRFSPFSTHEPSGWRTARLEMLYASEPAFGSVSAKPASLRPAAGVGEEALLLLVRPEHVDAFEPNRLVHAQDDGQGGVDLGEGLEHTGIAGLGQALPAVSLGHVEAHQTALPEFPDHVVADPAVLLDLARVQAGAELLGGGDQGPLLLLSGIRLRPGEDEVLVDLATEQGLGERGGGLLRARPVNPCLRCRLHRPEPTPNLSPAPPG